MEIVIALLLIGNLALTGFLLWKTNGRDDDERIRRTVGESISLLSGSLTSGIQNMSAGLTGTVRAMGESLNGRVTSLRDSVLSGQSAMNTVVDRRIGALENRLTALEQVQEVRQEALRKSVETGLSEMRRDNEKKLDEIRGVVDEKLQESLEKRISESFRTVSSQLEQVYKGLGEMQHLAADVGGLKQVLSGVKTRGILGEIQLGAILEEILAPEQYDTNVPTVPGSRERVEFAVKLPGSDGGSVYLPIDSKFPGDAYMHYQEALQSGDQVRVQEARRQLSAVLRKSARDIREKYVEPPHTTAFGILFLPFEGLYADVVNLGLLEVLQRDFNINVAGPSTMAALLNSLQMGFRTLAIQKRSGEVWQVLGEVKTEFGKFEDTMKKMQTHLRQTSDDLDSLMGTRSRAIQRKLRAVSEADTPGENLLGIEDL